jgi:prepilin-type N-terminal cleavage/methylation domain-containing protein
MRNINIRLNGQLNRHPLLIKCLINYLPSNQSGFSLLESLMAVAVVGILMTAILPMMVVTTSSRVQARRIDLASQAARSYIDGVRSGTVNIIDAPGNLTEYPFAKNVDPNVSFSQYFMNVDAPSSSNVTNLFKIPGVRVDSNGDGFRFDDPQDLVIQPMRSRGSGVTPNLAEQGFYMGVRVYRADAFQNDTAIKPGINFEKSCANANQIFGGGGASPGCPLVVMKVDVYPSTSTMSQIKGRL